MKNQQKKKKKEEDPLIYEHEREKDEPEGFCSNCGDSYAWSEKSKAYVCLQCGQIYDRELELERRINTLLDLIDVPDERVKWYLAGLIDGHKIHQRKVKK